MITRYVPFVLTLEAPLTLAAPDGDPDGAASLTFIPGSALRGAAAQALRARGLDKSSPDAFRLLILSGVVRYLNAYLAVAGQRGLPAPAVLRRGLDGGVAFEPRTLAQPPQGELRPLPDSVYCTGDAVDGLFERVRTSVRTHRRRDRSAGAAAAGTLFRFEAIDAGQEFHGLLAVGGEDEATVARDVAALQEALGGLVLLGRSRRAGYGGAARLAWGPPREREAIGGRLLDGDQAAGATFRVLLASDYVGRHPLTGQVDPAAFGVELRGRLGDRVEVAERDQTFRLVGGYSRTWGLELPQGLALKAGSVFVVRATQPIPFADLLAVEHRGLGERRAEGFGRVLFLKPPDGPVTLRAAPEAESRPPEVSPPPLLQTLQRRLLEDVMEERIVEAAARLASSAEGVLPPRRLLGQLRVPLRRPPRDALGELREWLEGLRGPARRALEACILVDGGRRESLEHWLLRTAGESDLAALLGYDELAGRYHFATAEAARATLDNAGFANRTRLRLLDAVLAALARESARRGASSTQR